jgi:hypothetical protein
MDQWTEKEWCFCLSSFYHARTFKLGMAEFGKNYKRSKKDITLKFEQESICLTKFIGSRLKDNVTKQLLISELKNVYKILGSPFNQNQFNSFSSYGYHIIVGYFGSWDSALEQAGLLKKFQDYKQITEQIKTFNPEKELKDNWKKEKEQLLHKAEVRKVNYLKTQAQKLDIVNQMILEAVAKVEPLFVEVNVVKPTPIIASVKPKCTLWFEFSDLQLGTLITSEEMGGLNHHNWVIWQEKLNVWKKNVIEKIKAYKQSHTIDSVVVACLGDMVEGQEIFKSQIWKIDTNVVDQAINGANDTAAAFTEIFLTHHDVHFDILEVFGNHGRIGGKGDTPYSCSMDKVYQRMLQSQLEKVKQLKNYTYHLNEAWFYFVEIYGWNHLLLHGDQGMSKLWSSRPTINGLEKGLIKYSNMFQDQVHFLHVGHFHNDWVLSFNMSQMLINGSFIGTSGFSAMAMVASSPPIQVMHVFEPRVGLSKTERIFLLEGQIKKSIKPKKLKNLE